MRITKAVVVAIATWVVAGVVIALWFWLMMVIVV